MTTLREAADAVRDMPIDVLAQFDAVFRPVPLDHAKPDQGVSHED